MIDLECSDDFNVQLSVNPKTKAGLPAEIEAGSLEVLSDNTDLAEGVIQEDGTPFVTVKAPGVCIITVSGDADLGDGVVTISDQLRLTITHAMAANLGLGATLVPKATA